MTTSVTTQPIIRFHSATEFATVRESLSDGHKGLFTNEPFCAGDVLCAFSARETHATPSRLTLQTGPQEHILLSPECLQYANHSCAPNIFFDTTTRQIIALTNIQAGEALTFFYPSTEWAMDEPFACRCGAASCLQEIRGAASLSAEVLQRYRLTDFIQQQLAQASRLPLASNMTYGITS